MGLPFVFGEKLQAGNTAGLDIQINKEEAVAMLNIREPRRKDGSELWEEKFVTRGRTFYRSELKAWLSKECSVYCDCEEWQECDEVVNKNENYSVQDWCYQIYTELGGSQSSGSCKYESFESVEERWESDH